MHAPIPILVPSSYNLTNQVRTEEDMRTWQMQDAKARLSELLKLTSTEGPQEITVHGRPVAVVLSPGEFDRLSGQQASLVEFMQASPLAGLDEELRLERDPSPTREIAL